MMSTTKMRGALTTLLAVFLLGSDLVCGEEAREVTVTVDVSTVLHTVSEERYHGTNLVALWNDTGDHPGAVRAFSQMNLGLLRFPGGVPCQWYDWEHPLDTGFTQLTPEKAWAMAKNGGAQMIFQTNTATDKTGKNKNTGNPYKLDNSARHAADWVRAASKNKIEVAFWEIGNEPEMDAPEAVKKKKTQEAVYDWYNAKYAEQAKAIRSADPRARLLGPASTNVWFWWAQKNLEKFLKAHGNKGGTGLADAISLHWYPEHKELAWEKTRGTAQEWPACMEYIQKTVAQYDSRKLPVYLTEWNWGASDKNNLSQQMSNALGCADIIGMFQRTGVAGHTQFCLQKIANNWGVLAMQKDALPQNHPSPTYFGLLLAAKLGGDVLKVTHAEDEKNVLSAYATHKKNGALQIMLINKDAKPLNIIFALPGYELRGATMTCSTLRGARGGVQDTQVIYNGVASPDASAGDLPASESLHVSLPLRCILSPYSLTVLEIFK